MAQIIKPQVKKTWKPIAAGILDIIFSWSIGSILLVGILLAIGMGGSLSTSEIIFFGCAFAIICLAFVGGFYATLRRRWLLSLSGSIGAFLLSAILPTGFIISGPFSSFVSQALFVVSGLLLLLAGITPVVLTALSKNEFV